MNVTGKGYSNPRSRAFEPDKVYLIDFRLGALCNAFRCKPFEWAMIGIFPCLNQLKIRVKNQNVFQYILIIDQKHNKIENTCNFTQVESERSVVGKSGKLPVLKIGRWPVAAAATLALVLASVAAHADEASAGVAISEASAKIEMASRQSGQAGDLGDQSFNTARARLAAAQDALKAGRDEQAKRLAEEASVLADLTTERAKLAALRTSHDLVANSVAQTPRDH